MNTGNKPNERLKDFRKKTGLSQKDFAVKIGVNHSYYSDVENSRRSVTNKLLDKIKVHYPISPEWIQLGVETEIFNPSSLNLMKKIVTKNIKISDLSTDEQAKVEDFIKTWTDSNRKHEMEEIRSNPNNPKLFESRFRYEELHDKELGKLNMDLYDFMCNVDSLSEINKEYIEHFEKFEATAKTYKEYKSKKFKHFEKYKKYHSAIANLNVCMKAFFSEFKQHDAKGIIQEE